MAAPRPNIWDVWQTIVEGAEQDDVSSSDNDSETEDVRESDSDIDVREISDGEGDSDEVEGGDDDDNLALGENDVPNWTDPGESFDIDPFVAETGPQMQIPHNATELDVFMCFFTPEMMQKIVDETNAYARYKQQLNGQPDAHWSETTVPEMSAFLGILILMGIVQLPDYKFFWSSNKFVMNSGVKDVMPKHRYEKINQYLHLNDSSQDDENDKLYKVRPLLDSVSRTCSSLYKPNKNQSIDEGMIPYKGRFSCKQYMPAKPVKWGIKVWMRCDSVSGFCHQLDIYLGKHHCPNDGKGLPYHVVTNLTRELIGKSHHVYFDSYFTSIKLAKDLLGDGIYMCGTIRQNRKNFPADIQGKNLPAPLNQGQYVARQTDDMAVVTWMDKRQVSVLATNDSLGEVDMVDRKRKDGTVGRITRPRMISNYQENFRGVDICDQLRAKYPVGRSSKKWWRCIMYFLLNVCIINAFIVYQELIRSNQVENNRKRQRYSQLDFRLNLIGQLINGFSCTAQRKKRSSVVPLGNDNSSHAFGRLGRKRSSCKHCPKYGNKKRKVTTTGCMSCDKHLCSLQCHRLFHASVGVNLEE